VKKTKEFFMPWLFVPTKTHILVCATLLCGMLSAIDVQAASPFDGTYSGQQTVTEQDNTAFCYRAKKPIKIKVSDGTFNFRLRAKFKPNIAADGTFKDAKPFKSSGKLSFLKSETFSGKFSNGTLEADAGESCVVHISAKKN